MAMRDGFDWVNNNDGTWDIYTTDRKIARITKNSKGQWHSLSDLEHAFDEADVLIRLLDRGVRDGF